MALVRRLSLAGTFFLLLSSVVAAPGAYASDPSSGRRDEAYRSLLMLTRAMEIVRRSYVDEEKTAYTNLVHGALRGMLSSLDEHSSFLDQRSFAVVQDETVGQFGGVGIVIGLRDGALTVIAPIEDTPAFRAGILAGDRIVEIDGAPTEGLDVESASRQLRGEPGTKVTIRVVRGRTREIKVFEIVRAVIDVATVKDARILEDGIAYLRITQFNDRTASALEAQLKAWTTSPQPPRALILDLRNNPGGLLRSAIDVAQLFLRSGQIVVHTQGREASTRQVFVARNPSPPVTWPMAVLVNSGSASASEVLAGALKDHRRAVLIGEKTFGKGSVQTILPLEEGTALRLTTARYQTPNRITIHGYGIEPDIVVPMPAEMWQAILRRRNEPPEAPESGAPAEASDATPPADLQLERAVGVLKGILLYRAAQEERAARRVAPPGSPAGGS